MKDLFQTPFIRVGLILVAALMLIIYFDPPHTPCQSQVEIYSDAIKPLGKQFAQALKVCKDHTDPGGCVGFIEVVGKLENKYNEVGHQCQPTLKTDSTTQMWITGALEVFVKAAWGSKPPANYTVRNGWLGISELVEFCRLRQQLETVYGAQAWTDFYESMLRDLPGAPELGRNEAWARSIVSDQCHYPL